MALFAYFECAEVLGKWCEEGQKSQDLPRLLLLTQAPADTSFNSIFLTVYNTTFRNTNLAIEL